MFYTSMQVENSCYFINYFFPQDTELTELTSFPAQVNQSFAKAAKNTVATDKGQANLIIKLRKTNPNPDFICQVWDNPFRESAPFQPLDEYIAGLR